MCTDSRHERSLSYFCFVKKICRVSQLPVSPLYQHITSPRLPRFPNYIVIQGWETILFATLTNTAYDTIKRIKEVYQEHFSSNQIGI